MQYLSVERLAVVSLMGYCLFFQSHAWAFNLNFRSFASLQELYSDNIRLAPAGSEESALVTEVRPGFNINGQSARYRLNLNYSLQSIYNAGGNSNVDVNHQLQYNSTTAFVPNRLFLDTRSTVSQQNISNTQIGGDNFSNNGNSTTLTTFSLSPYWTPHFSHYANGLARLTYDRVGAGSSQISDTNSHSETVSLVSGRYFSRFGWSANFNNRTNQNSDGQDVSFQNSSALLRYNINRKLNLTAQVGHSSNDFQNSTNSNNNGVFYTLGGQWRPSRNLNVSAGYGNNKFITVFLSPISRLRWTTTYRNNDIGTNTGNIWQTDLRYVTRRSVWSGTFNEDTTTVQQVLLERQFFILDGSGNITSTPDPTQAQFFLDLPTLTDEVFTRKRGQLNYSFRTGKSVLTASAFSERRTFQISQNKDEVYGGSGAWSWRYSSRLNTLLSLNWQKTDTNNAIGSVSNKFFDVLLRAQRTITRNVSGNIEYRYLKQSSDQNTLDFDENRISISLSGRF
ncbi:MAG: TIGR03016 family PEP-CTERM system-associated outer membrane protein [Gammaproteobacteria bacterium HGW-Gammaproteobacteria-3]|nr:MAG: TIGR03016 family PEP-CTERM system-associated outer membrane protein [Gammaproteobacteria bacterium HGW-Gammaproteobacteria-3]